MAGESSYLPNIFDDYYVLPNLAGVRWLCSSTFLLLLTSAAE